MQPVGIMLAQHNHQKVYLRGRDFSWPGNNRVIIALSEFSNEPYLVQDGREPFYAPASGNISEIEFLFSRSKKRLFSARTII